VTHFRISSSSARCPSVGGNHQTDACPWFPCRKEIVPLIFPPESKLLRTTALRTGRPPRQTPVMSRVLEVFPGEYEATTSPHVSPKAPCRQVDRAFGAAGSKWQSTSVPGKQQFSLRCHRTQLHGRTDCLAAADGPWHHHFQVGQTSSNSSAVTA